MRVISKLSSAVFRLVASIALGAIGTAVAISMIAPSFVDIWEARTTESTLPDLSTLEQTTIIYDMNGDPIAELRGDIDREPVDLSQVSQPIIDAVLAMEDAKFYQHNGINPPAILRAFATNVSAGGVQQGGSTITQQLVKLALVGNEESVRRKIEEAATAVRLEKEFSKEEILERYLNTVYFGGGAYGVQAAAELYYAKDASELDHGEAALLAGIIANPSAFDPIFSPSRSLTRRGTALSRMVEEGYITSDERDEYQARPLPRVRQEEEGIERETYFVEEVRRTLLDDERLAETREERQRLLLTGGLEIYTTFDPQAQALAENAVEAELPIDNKLKIISAVVSVEPGTGAVRAMVGGPGFDKFEFNAATQKGRPTGSSFKPFVLAAAFEHQGIVPSDSLSQNSPCVFDNPSGFPNPYKAADYNGGRKEGLRSIRAQTLGSTNCGFLRLGQIAGLNNVVETARTLGVQEANLQAVISAPLGPIDVTPLEMATAYATFANDGVRAEPYYVDRIVQGDRVIFEHEPETFRAVSTQTARLVTDILEDNISCPSGCTGRRARIDGHQSAGKTGTGQDNFDAWFVGYTKQLATAVWMGGQDGQVKMRINSENEDVTRQDFVDTFGQFAGPGVTGGSIPATIWGRYMNGYMAGFEPIDFDRPEPTRSGKKLASPDDEDGIFEVEVSPCGSDEAEVDTDGNGLPDACRDLGGLAIPEDGICPTLLFPRDTNGDGVPDRCETTPPTTLPPSTLVPPSSDAPPPAGPATTAPINPLAAPPTTQPGGTPPAP